MVGGWVSSWSGTGLVRFNTVQLQASLAVVLTDDAYPGDLIRGSFMFPRDRTGDVLGRNIVPIFVAIGAIACLDMARIVRGQTLSLRSKEFIEGCSHVCVSKWKIITRHIKIPPYCRYCCGLLNATYSGAWSLQNHSYSLVLVFKSLWQVGARYYKKARKTMEVAIWQLAFPAVSHGSYACSVLTT